MAGEAEDLKSLLAQAKELYRLINNKPLSIDSAEFKNVEHSLEKAQLFVKELNNQFNILKGPASAFKESVHLMQINAAKYNSTLDQTNKAFRSLTTLTNKISATNILDYKRSTKSLLEAKSNLANKHNILTEIQKQLATEEEDLRLKITVLRTLSFTAKRQAEINKLSKEWNRISIANADVTGLIRDGFDDIYTGIDNQLSQIGALNKKLGLTPNIISGIDRGLRKLGFNELADRLGLQDAVDKSKDFALAQGEAASKMDVAKVFTSNIVSNLTKALGPAALMVAAFETIKKVFSLMFDANKEITSIANNFGKTKDEAEGIRRRMFQISDNVTLFANTSNGVLLTYKDISKALGEINESLGIGVDFTSTLNNRGKILLAQYANARENLGLSTEASKEALSYAQIQGKEFDDILNNIVKQNIALTKQGLSLKTTRQTLGEVLKITGTMRANFKGSVDEMAKGVAAASLLGTTLDQVAKTQESLLDFESSIQNELEAELLTGKNLNLERARGYALQGDMNGLMKELNANAISFGEFTKMNVIQQESFAKAIGMDRGELADILFQKQALGSIQKNLNKEQQRALTVEGQRLKALGQSTTQINEGVAKYALQLASQQDAQSKFNNALIKAQEIFTRLVEGKVFDRLANALTKLVDFLGGNTGEHSRGNNLVKQAQSNPELGKILANRKLTAEDVENFPALEQFYNNQESNKKTGIKVDDFVIKTAPKDTIVAAGGTKMGNNDEIVRKLNELIDAVSKGGSIYLDGVKVTTEMEKAHQRYSRQTQ